jgi:hypothetical protein
MRRMWKQVCRANPSPGSAQAAVVLNWFRIRKGTLKRRSSLGERSLMGNAVLTLALARSSRQALAALAAMHHENTVITRPR